jgi:hypothetical protein
MVASDAILSERSTGNCHNRFVSWFVWRVLVCLFSCSNLCLICVLHVQELHLLRIVSLRSVLIFLMWLSTSFITFRNRLAVTDYKLLAWTETIIGLRAAT